MIIDHDDDLTVTMMMMMMMIVVLMLMLMLLMKKKKKKMLLILMMIHTSVLCALMRSCVSASCPNLMRSLSSSSLALVCLMSSMISATLASSSSWGAS